MTVSDTDCTIGGRTSEAGVDAPAGLVVREISGEEDDGEPESVNFFRGVRRGWKNEGCEASGLVGVVGVDEISGDWRGEEAVEAGAEDELWRLERAWNDLTRFQSDVEGCVSAELSVFVEPALESARPRCRPPRLLVRPKRRSLGRDEGSSGPEVEATESAERLRGADFAWLRSKRRCRIPSAEVGR